MDNKELHVLFSSDDNYAQHLGAAIYSLLVHNSDFEVIQIYVIDNEISDANKERLKRISLMFPNSNIFWIPFNELRTKLKLNMAWDISISTYARLFLAELLPKNIERVLYMDCDMIACDTLMDLWNTDLQDKVLGAVQDNICDNTKAAVGLLPQDPYFNAGLLLVNVDAWRKQNIGEACLRFIDRHEGKVIHHDQGALNGVLKDKWLKLSVGYNLMTIHYVFNLKQVYKYFGDKSAFYTKTEIERAKRNPTILHYTPSFTSRPWVRGCAHPKMQGYWSAVNNTPWKGAKPEPDLAKWYVKLINWRYRKLPF